MKIESIEIKNFRLFSHAKITHIPKLCVLVGANGTGKSTLFDVFSFLKDALEMNVSKAVSKRGGYKELASRGYTKDPIEITLQFRLEITGYERLVTYVLEIAPDSTGRAMVQREVLRYKRGANGKPYHFLDFARGKGYSITNEEDFSKPDETLHREEQELCAPDILAIKGLGQFKRFKAASAFRTMIENWYISDFHVSEARHSQEEEFRDYAERGGQAFISTHSPDFLNALTLDEIYCLRKEQGFTTITRASESATLRALYDAGDLPGYLWKQGLFECLNQGIR